MSGPDVQVERVYDEPEPGRRRVLADRLWPRGISKERAALDEWNRDLAPSTELRRWYDHDPERFDEFADRYRAELDEAGAADAVTALVESVRDQPLSLVTATRDVEHSGAVVLLEVVRARLDADADR